MSIRLLDTANEMVLDIQQDGDDDDDDEYDEPVPAMGEESGKDI